MEEDWLSEFKEECGRNIRRSVTDRIRYGFSHDYEPTLDKAPWRSFNSMEEYRQWCDENLPMYLGYCTSEEISQDSLDEQTALIARREIERRKALRP